MSDYSTLWLQKKVNQVATNAALQAIAQTGKALPCSVTAVNGAFVTVSFEVQIPYDVNGVTQYYTLPPVTMSTAQSQWIRIPITQGDVGLTMPADTFLTGITGGGGVPTLDINPGNLSALVFVPIGTQSFPSLPAAGHAWINGPNGAVLSDQAQTASVTVSANLVTIKAGASTWTFAPGAFTMASGVVAETHIHPGVATGSGDTGAPIA